MVGETRELREESDQSPHTIVADTMRADIKMQNVGDFWGLIYGFFPP